MKLLMLSEARSLLALMGQNLSMITVVTAIDIAIVFAMMYYCVFIAINSIALHCNKMDSHLINPIIQLQIPNRPIDQFIFYSCSNFLTRNIFTQPFWHQDITGVCWRNWIAHLTTEEEHLCNTCCHQEVPGSSPG